MIGAAAKVALKPGAKQAMVCAGNNKCRNSATGGIVEGAKFVGEVKGALKGPPTAAPPTAAPQQVVAAPPNAAAPQQVAVQPQGTVAMSKGGVVRKGGRYYLHKGEKVVSKRSVPKVTKAMQKAGMTLRHKGRAAVKKVPFIPMNKIRNMANGGTVLKTGLHLLKPGQRVIPASKAAKARKAIAAAKARKAKK